MPRRPKETQYSCPTPLAIFSHQVKCPNRGWLRVIKRGVKKLSNTGWSPQIPEILMLLSWQQSYSLYRGEKQVCLSEISRKRCQMIEIEVKKLKNMWFLCFKWTFLTFKRRKVGYVNLPCRKIKVKKHAVLYVNVLKLYILALMELYWTRTGSNTEAW